MAKESLINQVADELHESILATVKRQRRFRSGTFWNKFKFERRTKDRGKRDAIIETKDEPTEILLAAEWEWDYEDIFGKGKELDKLKATCRTNPTANAFLLVYCPNSKYLDYLERIAEDWIRDPTMDEQAPTLFLHTVIFEERGNSRKFLRMKTVMIHSSRIDVWGDRYL